MVLFLTRLIQDFTRYPAKLSLQSVLVVPFVLQIFMVVGLTGYLSFKNGQTAVDETATELLKDISLRVEQNLQTFLETPHQINQINADAINLNILDINNFILLKSHFFNQSKVFNQVSLIGFANTNKELVAAESFDDGFPTIRISDKSTNYNLRTYTTNSKGQTIAIKDFGKPYNPERRDWYNKAIQTKKETWSEIYPHNSGIALYIAASQPVYDQKSNLKGVLLSNLNLKKIGTFLEKLQIGKTGACFIIERSSGNLVATSTNEKPFRSNYSVAKLPENKIKPLLATDSSDERTQATAKHLQTKFGNFNSIKSPQQLNFKKQFIQVLPFNDSRGIDWLIVVVVPEDDFMEKINANTRTTIILCIAALMVATVFGILVVRWITQPIVALKKSATAFAKGDWEKRLKIKRCDELGELANSFNSMADRLQITFSEMQTLNKALLESEIRLKQFLEAVPVGISIHDTTGQIYYVNRIAKEFFGIEVVPKAKSEELASVYQLYQSENQLYPTLQLPIVRSLAGETVEVDNVELHQPNKVIPLKVFSTPIFNDNREIMYAIAAFIDITERKQAQRILADYNQILQRQVIERTLELEREIEERKQVEETLREQKEILQIIFDHIPVMICFHDCKNEIQLVNPEYERVMGWKNEELKNVKIEYLLAQCFRNQEERALAQKLAKEGKWVDLTIKVRDGSYVDTSWIEIRLKNGAIIGIGQDIRDRKLAEKASILEERNRMAREIHDTLAQAFNGISIHLGVAAQIISPDDFAAQEHITLARKLSRTGLAEARASVQGLRSPFLENSNLYNAFNQIVTQISPFTKARINYNVEGIPYSLPLEVENNLLRIGQEALNNAVNHAGASVIEVELTYEKTQCVLRVRDNGRGFTIDNMTFSNGFGLVGMRERSDGIKAQLTINSQLGQGTDVTVFLQTLHK